MIFKKLAVGQKFKILGNDDGFCKIEKEFIGLIHISNGDQSPFSEHISNVVSKNDIVFNFINEAGEKGFCNDNVKVLIKK